MSAPEIKSRHIKWSIENEEILVEWCDYAQCYKWLNYRAEQMYCRLHAWFTIPAIILSTISGTASFAQASYPPEATAYIPMIIGSINIFVGIITTVQQYLKISELKEAHRVSEIAWGKLARSILIEIAKAPNERMDAGNFFKISRNEYDRLIETNPTIPSFIVQEFKNTFVGSSRSEKRQQFLELRKPDVCDVIKSANSSRHKWYMNAVNQPMDVSFNLPDVFKKMHTDTSFNLQEFLNMNHYANLLPRSRENTIFLEPDEADLERNDDEQEEYRI